MYKLIIAYFLTQMWHESLRDFLSSTIINIDSEEYTMNLGKAQVRQNRKCKF